MRAVYRVLAIVTLVLITFANSFSPVVADGPSSVKISYAAAPDNNNFLGRLRPIQLRRYAAACGLCTNVDCCGGASLGWKLCKSNCPKGQYKCMQVAACP